MKELKSKLLKNIEINFMVIFVIMVYTFIQKQVRVKST